MKRKITRLWNVIVLIGVFAISLTAQVTISEMETVSFNKQGKTDLLLRNSTSSKPDSALTYAATGELSSKTLYKYDASGNIVLETTLDWIDNSWVNVTKTTYEYNGEFVIKEYYKWETGTWNSYGFSKTLTGSKISYKDGLWYTFYYPSPYGITEQSFGWMEESVGKYEYKCTPTYDFRGNLTYLKGQYFAIANPGTLYPAFDFAITYNSVNQPILIIGTENTVEWFKVEYQYNASGEMVFFEHLYLNKNINEWECLERYENIQGTIEEVNNSWDGTTKTISKTDNNGNIYTKQFYTLTNDKWYMTHYTIYYPNSLTSALEPENNTPIDQNNQGNFDLNIHIPIDSVQNGSLVIRFPKGFTLDEANTSLTLDFANKFELTITKQENNSWLFEIKPKSQKNAALKADEAAKLLHIAYQVDESVEKGIYDIVINHIQFETPGGNLIPEPAITIPAEVNRGGVANEEIEGSGATVYITNNTLSIQTTQAEHIAVYTINGSKLYESTVQSGTTTIDASTFPQGILIVKGSSGWVKKVVK